MQSEKPHISGYCSFFFCTESYACKNQYTLNTLTTPTPTGHFETIRIDERTTPTTTLHISDLDSKERDTS